MRAALLAFAMLCASCARATSELDAGLPDAGPFDLSGAAQLFPLAASWQSAQDGGFSFQGLQLGLEDPFVELREPDAGLLGQAALGDDGTFAFAAVDGTVALGVAAIVADPRGCAAFESESMLFEGGAHSRTGTTAYALPLAFERALGDAIGVPDLEAQGFLLGQVVDAQGAPVSGASVAGVELDSSRVKFLGGDLKPLPDAAVTDESGAFLVVGAVDLMNFSVVNHPELGERKAISVPGRAFLVLFQAP